MEKRTKSEAGSATLSSRLMLLAMMFLVGAVVGSYFAAGMSGAGRQYIESVTGGPWLAGFSGLWPVVACDLVLLAAVFGSAFIRLGMLASGLALAVKGFALSTLITAFVGAYGVPGFLVSISAAFFFGFVPVTCLVLVSLQAAAISAGRLRAGRGGRVYIDKAFFLSTGICAVIIMASSALHAWITPALGHIVATIS